MSYRYKGREIHMGVELYHDAIPYAAGVSMRDFFRNREEAARAWREGLPRLKEMVGDICRIHGPFLPPLSYGHLACLGAPVHYPEHGEPNVSPFAGSVDEAVAMMKEMEGIDFPTTAVWREYEDWWAFLKDRFPDQKIAFNGPGEEGPVTSCVLMRGQDFLLDLYDQPEKSKEFLRLMADSAVAYTKQLRRMNRQPEVQDSCGLADDFASLISPEMWPEFVIPALLRHYEGLATPGGRRSLHLENLTPRHLPLLSSLGLAHFQPSVSAALTLENLRANLDPGISFDWLLYAYRVLEMTDQEIQDWVDRTVEAGVTRIRTQVGSYALMTGRLDRVRAFVRAFKKYEVPD